MSDLATRPQELVCGSAGRADDQPLLITARRVVLGRTTEVARVLPDRTIRMIGAWCFLDHYGPEDVSGAAGMRVHAHPHTGLQTVSWLLDGEIEHRDSLGSQVLVRPGQLHVMTAGHGIVHSELSLPDHPPLLHGVQLWVALPDHARDIAPRFDSYPSLPSLEHGGVRITVLIGTLHQATSPAVAYTPLVGAQLDVDAYADTRLSLDPDFEHGLFVISGQLRVGDVDAGVDQLVYLSPGHDQLCFTAGADTRLLLLGGRPFEHEIVMWWNFIGRTHEEVVAFRTAWENRHEPEGQRRFPHVVDADERVMEAPPMPTTRLKPRPPQAAS